MHSSGQCGNVATNTTFKNSLHYEIQRDVSGSDRLNQHYVILQGVECNGRSFICESSGSKDKKQETRPCKVMLLKKTGRYELYKIISFQVFVFSMQYENGMVSV